MRCLETRRTLEGYKRRRYEDVDGQRHSTIEVPLELWDWLNNQGRSQNRMAEILRERERLRVKAHGLDLIKEGWRTIAIAHELGVSLTTVLRWRKTLQLKT